MHYCLTFFFLSILKGVEVGLPSGGSSNCVKTIYFFVWIFLMKVKSASVGEVSIRYKR
eukprot:m.58571 g.58571  ORF g.58571 m.58571 type:complete len:58 (+) comp11270_c1_seq2:552-725(+)